MHPSSILSSEQAVQQPGPLRKFVTTLLITIMVVVGFDQVLGFVLGRLVQDIPWVVPGQERNGYSIENLWRFNDAGVNPIVFTGSSQMQTGFSPHVFDAQLQAMTGQAVNSVNISMEGSGTVMARDVIKNLIIPTRPPILIYGIEMRALNVATDTYLKLFRESPLGYALALPDGIEKDLMIWLSRHSGLLRYRSNIQLWFSSGSFKRSIPEVDDRGYFNLPAKFPRNDKVLREQFLPFSVGADQQSALEDIDQRCQVARLPCILMNMPLHEAAYRYIPPETESTYLQALRAIAAQADVPIWNFDTPACRAALGDESFYDVTHLNTTGASKFTQMVALIYAQQMLRISQGASSCADVILP